MSSLQEKPALAQPFELSIVIVNHNTGQLLQTCLQSLYDTMGTLNCEIFVMDNASSDGSVEMVRSQFPQVRLITHSEGLGFTRAANLALRQGQANYFLISHPDVQYLPGTLQEMLKALSAEPSIGIVGANLLYPDGSYNPCSIVKCSARRMLIQSGYSSFKRYHLTVPWLYPNLRKAQATLFWDHQADTESESIWNACMMLKREVIETVGGFHEEFFVWFSDADLCYRAKNAGWKLVYLVKPKVIHYEKQSTPYLDNELVSYKVAWNPAVERLVAQDRLTLIRRHFGLSQQWFAKSFDACRYWIRYLRYYRDSTRQKRRQPKSV
jgi:GT2 family glycosyltransferase